jgi:hypothetical protein
MSITLREALMRLTVPDLKELRAHLDGVQPPGRKDDLIQRIADQLLGPRVKVLWDRLDEMQQAALAEAVHHPQGEYSPQRFQAKYRKSPLFRIDPPKTGHGYGYGGSSKPSALALFIHDVSHMSVPLVPSDLQAVLRTFVPLPPPLSQPSLATLDPEDGLTLRLTEREALQEVVLMLHTLDQTPVQVSEKTARPGASALRLISGLLPQGDFYPLVEKADKWSQEIGPIKAFAWPMLLQAGGLAARTGTRLTLSPAGRKALGSAPAEALRTLWRKWLKTTLFDEFSRIEVIKGQGGKGHVMGAVPPRRAEIETALIQCPPGRWVEVKAFSRYMQASDLNFVVAHDPWRLYIADSEYGSLGHSGFHDWNILQERYIMALLFEYAATLGLVDVAYRDPAEASCDWGDLWGTDELDYLSRYDGLQYFRITPLGAYVLGIEATYQPAELPSNLVLSVLPSLRIQRVSGECSPEETQLLNTWAGAPTPEGWQLDRSRALAAVERGSDITELRHFLESRVDQPLPEPVASFIQRCERDGHALRPGASALLIECRDVQTADTVAGHKETASLCLRAAATTLVVRTEHLDKFRERVRILGLGMTV